MLGLDGRRRLGRHRHPALPWTSTRDRTWVGRTLTAVGGVEGVPAKGWLSVRPTEGPHKGKLLAVREAGVAAK